MSRKKLKEAVRQLGSPGADTRIHLTNRRSKPQLQHVNVQYRTYHIPNEETDPLVCPVNTCANCKQAICSFNSFFCTKTRGPVDRTVDCPHFELEPPSYRLFIRT